MLIPYFLMRKRMENFILNFFLILIKSNKLARMNLSKSSNMFVSVMLKIGRKSELKVNLLLWKPVLKKAKCQFPCPNGIIRLIFHILHRFMYVCINKMYSLVTINHSKTTFIVQCWFCKKLKNQSLSLVY